MLPRSLIQLDSLEVLDFGGQDLCAPSDQEFQAWIGSIPSVNGPTCAGMVEFAGGIANQVFTMGARVQGPDASRSIGRYRAVQLRA